MRTTALACLVLPLWALPLAAAAQEAPPGDAVGDAAAGAEHFDGQCVACHVIRDEAGEVLAGRNGRNGPNLYGVAGRVPGSVEDYRYSDLMVTYGEQGAVWEEANTVAYLLDPTGHLREATGEDGRGKMAYQVRDEQEAHDLWAFLATFPASGEAAPAE